MKDVFRDDCDIHSSVDLELNIVVSDEHISFPFRVVFDHVDSFTSGHYGDIIFT